MGLKYQGCRISFIGKGIENKEKNGLLFHIDIYRITAR
jgi:hypothetical protein